MELHQLSDVIAEVAPDLALSFDGPRAKIATPSGAAQRTMHVRASLTPSAAARLTAEHQQPGFVVADIIDSNAEQTLQHKGWSYWDRRGRLRLWLPEISTRLDVPTRAYVTGADGPDPRRPVTGVGGVSLALALLIAPTEPPGVREIARLAGMAASTISRARQHLMQASLVDTDGTPVVPELFWATSDAWVVQAVPVSIEPDGPDWTLGGDVAAATWGAPVLATNRRWYCSDRSAFEPHRFRYHTEPAAAACEIAMTPTPLVSKTSVAGFIHPVVAALDLSRDSRGREILADWDRIDPAPGSPDPAGAVVWQ